MPQSEPTKRERRDAARAARLQREQAAGAAAARRRRLTILGGLLAAAAVIVVAAILISSGGGAKNASGGGGVAGARETQALLAGIPQRRITLGDPKAPATVVEFADPQCPFCKDYTLREMPALVQRYVRPGMAKMELRLLTFIGPESLTAARVLEATGLQDKLWNATDVLYHNQGQENSGYVTEAFLRRVLGAVPGLDVNKALADATSPRVAAELGAAQTLASRYGVNSTPTMLVGPTGGQLKKVASPTAAAIGRQIDASLAGR